MHCTNLKDGEIECVRQIIRDSHLSDYKFNKEDFLCLKTDDGDIIGFGRIYPLYHLVSYELSSIFIKETYRGQKLGLTLIEKLLEKFNKEVRKHNKTATIYLVTTAGLFDYYNEAGFELTNKYPNVIKKQVEWAEENNLSPIVMKI